MSLHFGPPPDYKYIRDGRADELFLNSAADSLMMELAGPEGPSKIIQNGCGTWEIETDAGSSFMFEIIELDRFEVASSYLKHLYEVATYQPPMWVRMLKFLTVSWDELDAREAVRLKHKWRYEKIAKHFGIELKKPWPSAKTLASYRK